MPYENASIQKDLDTGDIPYRKLDVHSAVKRRPKL